MEQEVPPAVSEPVVTENKKQGSGKGLKIGLVITSILAVAGIGFGVYEYICNVKKENNIAKLKDAPTLEAVVQAPEQTEEKIEDSSSQSETVITNEYVLRDLRHKINVLHGIYRSPLEETDYISSSLSYNFIEPVYTNNLNTDQKLAIAIFDKLEPAARNKNFYTNDYESKISEFIQSQPNKEWWNTIGPKEISYISYDFANSYLQDLFGSDISAPKANTSTEVCGADYLYIPSTDGYIHAAAGCGGAGFPLVYSKINSYKVKGDEAYVDIQTATAFMTFMSQDGPEYELYDGLYGVQRDGSLPTPTTSKEDGTKLGSASFDTTSQEVFNQYGSSIKSYRFVFKVNRNGTFYFSRVE